MSEIKNGLTRIPIDLVFYSGLIFATSLLKLPLNCLLKTRSGEGGGHLIALSARKYGV